MTPRGDIPFEQGARATHEVGVVRAPVAISADDPAPHASCKAGNTWRFLGPALLVSVGYMDPGNWATDLEGGARFGYDLLWVLLASNGMALLLQNLCARLGVVTGLNLATGCRAQYSRPLSLTLWILAEIGIIACDLAEVLGSAVALHLLFGIPTLAGAFLTSGDVLLILMLEQRGMRRLEAVVFVLLVSIGGCMLVELWLAQPSLAGIAGGLRPRLTSESLYVAIGILGATVMPHNLYLHSALVPRVSADARRAALRTNLWSTGLALNLALIVNAAILIVSAAAFWTRGLPVDDIRDAHELLTPLLGGGIASVLFAVGLLCAGQSASVSGTLAGQIVMEGFVDIRLHPALRRAVTRGLAILPAIGVLAVTGDSGLMPLLVGSQIVLSLQLPFAVIPLIKLTSSRAIMGDYTNGSVARWCASACALLIVIANMALVARTVSELWQTLPWVAALLAAAGAGSALLLLRVTTVALRSEQRRRATLPRDTNQPPHSQQLEQRAVL
jgi:manganese transport protein